VFARSAWYWANGTTRTGATTPWVTGACPGSGINSSPFATGPPWNAPTPMVKQEVLFAPVAPGTISRSRYGIRVKTRSRQPGTTDIPVASQIAFPAVSTVMSTPGRAPSSEELVDPVTGRLSAGSRLMAR
jgi:hypothetical protein